ncbi:ATP-grasp domain-containing protein [Ktedonosporobacter rubrisoli]|uniref:ATP-grasp domain-containing protein n=1 Tax=Ktedonosporobacter rubrisoli TaxID=2509675 RepID=A0A4P6JPF6_KTERU|nr:ATP-grasp domain-containing protein [Ktedonosporobacter rubrisoli]QBD77257.1 ATP-grasp domain-containing protein [Ktedonosporobacter rubrisoli]
MSPKLVFVESNTTGTGLLALSKAREMGLTPIFLTNNPQRYPGLEQQPCRVIICDTNSGERLQETIDVLDPDSICGITTTSEFYLVNVAQLTQLHGLPGNPAQAVARCRNKAAMRHYLAAVGMQQPAFVEVRRLSDLDTAIEQVGLPCVAKPVDDTASNAVRFCASRQDVEEQVSSILSLTRNIRGQRTAQAALLEAFIDAAEYSVETFSWQGHTTCLGITEKHLTAFPYFVEERHFFPAALSPASEQEMRNTVLQALEALGIAHGPAHTEVKLTTHGCQIIEINARLAGGMIPELIRYTSGIDLIEQQIKAVTGHEPDLNLRAQGCAGIQFLVSREQGWTKNIEGLSVARAVNGIKQITLTSAPGKQVNPPRSAYDRLGYIIAHTASYEQTTCALQTASSQIHLAVRNDSGNRVVEEFHV